MKTSMADRRGSRGTRRLRRLTVLGAAVALLATGACGGSSDTAKPAGSATKSGATASGTASTGATAALTDGQYISNAADFVDAAGDAEPTKVRIELGEDGAKMFFKPKAVTLEAGKAYQLELVNTGKLKHEFTAEKFFRSVATRKVESANSEVKVPFFTEVEVLAGKTVGLFVIPVTPGTYELVCFIPGHREAGMEGTITVTGSAPTKPAPVVGELAAGPWLQDGPARVEAASATWDAKAKTIQVQAGEKGKKMFFKPSDLPLTVGTPYVLQLKNVGAVKHEYTAAEFFPTVAFRKAQDAEGEYKGPLLKEAEVLPGKQLDLYLIPTKAGTFEIVCEIPGHREAGMVGKITVTK